MKKLASALFVALLVAVNGAVVYGGEMEEDAPATRRGGRFRQHRNRMIEFIDRLPDELDMTGEQKENFAKIRSELKEFVENYHKEHKEELREARKRMRNARGEEAQKAREEFRELMKPIREKFQQVRKELDEILTPEQKQKLKELHREQRGKRAPKSERRKSEEE
jgi:Spy/CpxP family protein refolding chaperone